MPVIAAHDRPTNPSPPRRWLTARQAARVLGIAAAAVERLARCGAFPGAVKGKKGWRIPARAAKSKGGVRISRARAGGVERDRRQEPVRIRPSELARQVRASRVPLSGIDLELPATRGACEGGPRPCVRVACRHNLYLDVCGSGALVLNAPGTEPNELATTCALDVAAQGGISVDRVAELLGSTRERIEQIEARALAKIAAAFDAMPR